MKRNVKKALYEKIMTSVAKEVKKAINENYNDELDEDWKGALMGTALGAASLLGGSQKAMAQYNGNSHKVEYHNYASAHTEPRITTYNYKDATKVTPEMDAQFKKLCNNGKILQSDKETFDFFVDDIKNGDVHNGFGYSGGVVELHGSELEMINQIQAVGASEMKMNRYKLAIVKYNGKVYLCGLTGNFYQMFPKLEY